MSHVKDFPVIYVGEKKTLRFDFTPNSAGVTISNPVIALIKVTYGIDTTPNTIFLTAPVVIGGTTKVSVIVEPMKQDVDYEIRIRVDRSDGDEDTIVSRLAVR